MAWADVTSTASVWSHINEGEAVWDGGSTKWDLSGNTYQTIWDERDDTWLEQT